MMAASALLAAARKAFPIHVRGIMNQSPMITTPENTAKTTRALLKNIKIGLFAAGVHVLASLVKGVRIKTRSAPTKIITP